MYCQIGFFVSYNFSFKLDKYYIFFNSIFSVSNKALQGAKSIGSFLYSAVNKAGKTVSEAGAKIKKTVGENVSIVIITYLLLFNIVHYIY